MARKIRYPGGVKPLTLKKARELALQEFGTAKGLEKDDHAPAGYFCMSLGTLRISIRNDTGSSERIKIEVQMYGYGHCIQLHDPETLKQDFDAEERYKQELKRETFKEWVDFNGPEFCHAEIDRVWKRLVGA